MMEKEIIVTQEDYMRIMNCVELNQLATRMPKVINRLRTNLLNARLSAPESIGPEVVTMNSTVLLRDANSGRENHITITYPQEAEPRERRVSVFSEIGVAVFGRREKQIVNWSTPHGMGEFEIVKVMYQPEAAGDFAL